MGEVIAIPRDEGSHFNTDQGASRNSMQAHHLQEATTIQTREGESLTAHELWGIQALKVSAIWG
jgi:hypothetical protein